MYKWVVSRYSKAIGRKLANKIAGGKAVGLSSIIKFNKRGKVAVAPPPRRDRTHGWHVAIQHVLVFQPPCEYDERWYP